MNLHTATSPDCPVCLGYGRVCSAHPDLAFGPGLPKWEYYPAARVCWCGAGARPCPVSMEDDSGVPRRSLGWDLKDMLLWALAAAALTVVFGWVLDVLEAWL
jgi:hypothetical protein